MECLLASFSRSRRRTPLLCTLGLLLLLQVSEGMTAEGEHPLCKDCGCLNGVPLVVDCTESSMSEPSWPEDSYILEWVGIFDDNPITHIPVLTTDDMLIKLSFRHSPVSSIADSAFANIPRLQSLVLSHCNLTAASFTDDAFKGQTKTSNKRAPLEPLEELDISHNKIESLGSYTFNHLTLLNSLIMTDNPIRDFDRQSINAFSELQNLVKLDLSRNQLVRIPHQFLAGMRKLETLVLSGNYLSVFPEEVRHAKSLKTLILDGNPILTISSTASYGPKSIMELSISSMPELTTVEEAGLGGLVNLTTLIMKNNPKLKYINKMAFISTLEGEIKLREVHLQNNALKTLDEELFDWESLTILDLQHNPWSCDCNLEWIIQPVQRMITVDPRHTRSVICAAPNDVTGQNIKHLIATSYSFPCPSSERTMNPHVYGPLIVVTLAVGVLLLMSATMLCTFVLYRKSKESNLSGRPVHYRRTTASDLESIAQSIET